MDLFLMDIRYAFRTLLRNPGFAAIAVLVLALGIGATTAIFSVVNAVLIRPLPYKDPSRLVALSSSFHRRGVSRTFPTVSLDEVEFWRSKSQSLEAIGSFVFTSVPVTVGRQSMFLVAIGADPELLDTLGVQPAMGRNLPGSGSKLKDPSVLISHRLWLSAFGGDPQVLGRPLTLDGSAAVVAGVLPPQFQFPRSDASYFAEEPDLVFPVADIADGWGRDSTQWFAIGRVRHGVAIGQASAELKTLTTKFMHVAPESGGMSVEVAALDAETTRSVRPALLLTLGITVVLLLIACTNIMNLLFSRAAQRGREMAVRKAIGATAGRLVRQMLTESACLTFIAGAIGVALAGLALGTLAGLSPAHLPISGRVDLDWTVLSFAVAACSTASILAGVLPAWHRSRQADTPIATARSAGNRRLAAFQGGLMVTQIALGLGLLAAAGVLAHSLFRLSSVNPGFRTENTLAFEMAFPSGRPAETQRLYEKILDATRSIPGVVSAGWITNPPPETRAGVFIPFKIAGAPAGLQPFCNFQVSSEDYFGTAGIPLVRGRDFSRADGDGAPQVAIVNETLARQYFPHQDPLGKRVTTMWEGKNQREIVGVIRDAHDRGLNAKPVPALYVPFRQFALGYGGVVVRTKGPAEAVIPQIRRLVAQVDPTVPLRNFMTLETRVHRTLDSPRFYTIMAMACALMAVLFVTLGLYGLISYTVSCRTAEIGIRMALGAPRRDILRGVLWQGLRMAAAGIVLGTLLALVSTRLLTSLLFEVKAIDPLSLAAAAATVIAVTLAASYFPARRASLVQPIVALRHE